MKNVEQLVRRAARELRDIGVDAGYIADITVDTRSKSRWGRCKKRWDAGRQCEVFKLEISAMLLDDDVSYFATMDTVMHEVIHTCPGCFNHGAEFKRVAKMVNLAYGYNVKRCTSAEEKNIQIEPRAYKYSLRCTKCGHVYRYKRATKLVQYIEHGDRRQYNYGCGVCKGNHFELSDIITL